MSSAVTLPTSRPVQADTKSIISATSSISICVAREDSQSMVPLAGSLTSHTSGLSTEVLHASQAAANQSEVGGSGDHMIGESQSEMQYPMKTLESVSTRTSPLSHQANIEIEDYEREEEKDSGEVPKEQHQPKQQQQQQQPTECKDPELIKEDAGSIQSGDKDIPKPDLVTSCDSSLDMEKENQKEERESMEKELSLDDSERSLTEDDLPTYPGATPVVDPTEN